LNGLELSRKFYFECVKPIIEKNLPAICGKYAAALVGYGSDVIGNDDELSRDHEWGPRCHLFLDEAVYSAYSSSLDKILGDNLPVEFSGFPARFKFTEFWGMVPVKDKSGYHHVVITTPARFLELTIGRRDIPISDYEWLGISEQRLLEFTSGEVFEDFTGELTGLRRKLAYFPEDVRLYRLAFILESLGWEDDLISLCGRRNDLISMHLNAGKTVERIMKLVFLLNRKYAPLYAKWLHREMKKLPEIAADIESDLLMILEKKNYLRKTEALNQVYEKILTVMESRDLCKTYPAQFKRSSSGLRYDIQSSAKDVFSRIKGNLRDIVIDGTSLGAVDQWMVNEDIVVSAEHMKAMLPVYKTGVSKRNKLDSLI
jgi:hypothetical protein